MPRTGQYPRQHHDEQLTGLPTGLRHTTTPQQIPGAAYEGAAFTLLRALDELLTACGVDPGAPGAADRPPRLIGGGARGRAWTGTVRRLSGRPVLLPAGTEPVAHPDRSFVTVLGTVLGPNGMDAYAEVLDQQPQPVARELDELPAHVDEQARQSLAGRLVPHVRGLRARHPGLNDLTSDAPRGRQHAGRTIGAAIADLYNPAQIDVMRRLRELLSDSGREPGT
ncbi:hypothetical protein ACIP93_27795 [Streptomyces sp. NPDC088745]|uniref:hypothetical protein n=1 Tax=Streptomyces sp. NPDC088745 TaxID=3365884 RepID=UPI0038110FE1